MESYRFIIKQFSHVKAESFRNSMIHDSCKLDIDEILAWTDSDMNMTGISNDIILLDEER